MVTKVLNRPLYNRTNIRNQEKYLPCGAAVKCIRNPLSSLKLFEWKFINIWSPFKTMFCPVLRLQYLPSILPSLIISRQSKLCIRNENNRHLLHESVTQGSLTKIKQSVISNPLQPSLDGTVLGEYWHFFWYGLSCKSL